jgi:hypothetical protein
MKTLETLFNIHPLFCIATLFIIGCGAMLLIYIIINGFRNATKAKHDNDRIFLTELITQLPITKLNYELVYQMFAESKLRDTDRKKLWTRFQDKFYSVSPYNIESEDHSPEEFFNVPVVKEFAPIQ